MEYTRQELQGFYGLITEENVQSVITPPMELTITTKERTIVYKTYNVEKKQLHQFEENTIENGLGQLLPQIKFLTRGGKYASLDARFEIPEKAKELSTKTIQSGSVAMPPLYFGRRTSKINIKHIALETNVG